MDAKLAMTTMNRHHPSLSWILPMLIGRDGSPSGPADEAMRAGIEAGKNGLMQRGLVSGKDASLVLGARRRLAQFVEIVAHRLQFLVDRSKGRSILGILFSPMVKKADERDSLL